MPYRRSLHGLHGLHTPAFDDYEESPTAEPKPIPPTVRRTPFDASCLSGVYGRCTNVETFFADDQGRSLLPRTARVNSSHPLRAFYLAYRKAQLNALFGRSRCQDALLPPLEKIKLSLEDLCLIADSNHLMAQATITCVDGYTTPLYNIAIGASELVHRFLILDLQRPGKPKIWLRIDRRKARDKSIIEFVGAGLRTPAHDTAQLADKKENLIDDSCIHESRQVLSKVRTLGDLRHYFRVINQELKIYQLWPANCWFLVSLLHQQLGETSDGEFVHGKLPSPSLAQTIRNRINKQFNYLPEPLTLSRLLMSINNEYLGHLYIADALALSLQWDDLGDPASSSSKAAGVLLKLQSIVLRMCELARRDRQSRRDSVLTPDLECSLLSQTAMLVCRARELDSAQWLPELGRLRRLQAQALRESSRIDEAFPAFEESISIFRKLYEVDATLYLDDLITSLDAYVHGLEGAKRVDEGRVVRKGLVELVRQHTDDLRGDERLVDILDGYTISLLIAGHKEEAYAVHEEALALCRDISKARREVRLSRLA